MLQLWLHLFVKWYTNLYYLIKCNMETKLISRKGFSLWDALLRWRCRQGIIHYAATELANENSINRLFCAPSFTMTACCIWLRYIAAGSFALVRSFTTKSFMSSTLKSQQRSTSLIIHSGTKTVYFLLV